MKRCRPYEWPPRSPDLILCDLYPWNCTKEKVKTKSCTLEDLHIRMQEVLNDIPHDILQRGISSIPGRLVKQVEASDITLKHDWLISLAHLK